MVNRHVEHQIGRSGGAPTSRAPCGWLGRPRERLFGIPEKESATELAGTVCGRLLLGKEISQSQMDAAKAFAETYAAYQRAIDSPRPPKAVEIGAATGRGAIIDVSREQFVRAIKQWDAAKAALVAANMYHPGSIYSACEFMVLRDQFFAHMLGDLRVGLNALARHYGLLAKAA